MQTLHRLNISPKKLDFQTLSFKKFEAWNLVYRILPNKMVLPVKKVDTNLIRQCSILIISIIRNLFLYSQNFNQVLNTVNANVCNAINIILNGFSNLNKILNFRFVFNLRLISKSNFLSFISTDSLKGENFQSEFNLILKPKFKFNLLSKIQSDTITFFTDF